MFSIVEPDDVRWVFLSHDDHDHTGNLNPAKFAAFADRVQSLGPRTISSAHSPVIPEAYVAQAFDLVRELPEITRPHFPNDSSWTPSWAVTQPEKLAA